MSQLYNILMLSCKKATELIEKKSLVGLTVPETMKLKLHTSMCSACNSYQKQSQILDQLLDQTIKSKSIKDQALTDESKQKIINNLEKD